MKKLFVKFAILGLLSAYIGHSATNRLREDNKVDSVETMHKPQVIQQIEETEQFSLFQLVEEENNAMKVEDVNKNSNLENKNTKDKLNINENCWNVEQKNNQTEKIENNHEVYDQNQNIDTSQQEIPKIAPTATPTPMPTASPNPTPQPIPEQTSQTTPQSTPVLTPDNSPTPAPQFDINYWVAFAQNYAQSIGLVMDNSAVDCWDNPINAGSHCKYLERDITDRLDRYKNLEGFTGVCIWSVELDNGTYDIYIGYV